MTPIDPVLLAKMTGESLPKGNVATDTIKGGLSGAATGATTGAAIGGAAGPVGVAIGTVLGSLLGLVQSAVKKKKANTAARQEDSFKTAKNTLSFDRQARQRARQQLKLAAKNAKTVQ